MKVFVVYDMYEMYTGDGSQCAITENIKLFASENDANEFATQRKADVAKMKPGAFSKPDRVIITSHEVY